VGGLERARTLEEHAIGLIGAIAQGGLGMFFHRFAEPGKL
jgi:hypothetical protein